MIVASLERTGDVFGVFTAYRWPRALLRRHRRSRSRVHGVGINIGRRLNPCHRFWQRAIFRGAAPPLKRQTRKNLCGCAIVQTHLCSHGEATMAATKELTSGQKAAQTRKRRAAGLKAAATRKRRATAAKAAATRKKNKA